MRCLFLRGCLVAISLVAAVASEAAVPAPREHFGFAIGDDYHLADYTQTEAYFKKIAAASDRVKLIDIGRTEENRTQWMLAISAPENIRDLDRYREIAARLARAEDLSDTQARALATEGKAVVWIDGGLHANETVATHQLIETAWQLASATDAETLRILRDTIVLCVHANPDGQELVSDWYMREPVPAQRVLTVTPRLYQKYIGHDNNRDFFMSAMRETTNLNRQLYLEWFPQVVYNHHQAGPPGTIVFVPPFRDPFNPVFDPLVILGIEAFGNAIQTRLLLEDKPGATSREGANYSAWWNGGLRTTAYFHNMIGLLTEIVGNPTPTRIPLVFRRQLPSSELLLPVAPQVWHFRQSIDYSVSANRAVLDQASRQREALLYHIYRMGRNSIERGQRDHWTPRPSRLDTIARHAAAGRGQNPGADGVDSDDAAGDANRRMPAPLYAALRKPEWRDPRGFIIPADQPDFPTAIRFLNALVKTGIAVQRATADFTVAGQRYAAGSYIVKTDQAFRPHILDMFEPQDHPNDFKVEGGPPTKPYDVAGWTLALQMGIKFDRVLDGFSGPFEKLPYGVTLAPPPRKVSPGAAGYLVTPRANDSALLVNRLLRAGAPVYRLKEPPASAPHFGPGAIYVPASPAANALVARAAESGLDIQPAAAPPRGEMLRLAPARIALWDRYGGSIPSGWTRWVLEQFEFPFEIVFPADIDAGDLRARYDAIILVSGAVPPPGGTAFAVNPPRNLPPEYARQLGRLTAEKSVPALNKFAEAGGTILALGSSINLAYQFGAPVKNALVEKTADGRERPLSEDKFYVPGSVLEARVDPGDPLAWGLETRANLYFDRSPALALPTDAAARGAKAIAWFDSAQPLRSGWAWGQKHLDGAVAVASVSVGAGKLHLFASEIAFRGQSHGTFKLVFNALQLATATPAAP